MRFTILLRITFIDELHHQSKRRCIIPTRTHNFASLFSTEQIYVASSHCRTTLVFGRQQIPIYKPWSCLRCTSWSHPYCHIHKTISTPFDAINIQYSNSVPKYGKITAVSLGGKLCVCVCVFFVRLPVLVDRDSSVGTATRYGLDGRGIESRWR